MRYEVLISEVVHYRITVTARNEDEAREIGLEQHNDGLSSEYDSGSPVVEGVTRNRG